MKRLFIFLLTLTMAGSLFSFSAFAEDEIVSASNGETNTIVKSFASENDQVTVSFKYRLTFPSKTAATKFGSLMFEISDAVKIEVIPYNGVYAETEGKTVQIGSQFDMYFNIPAGTDYFEKDYDVTIKLDFKEKTQEIDIKNAVSKMALSHPGKMPFNKDCQSVNEIKITAKGGDGQKMEAAISDFKTEKGLVYNKTPFTLPKKITPVLPDSSKGKEIFVSTLGNDDTGDGTEEKPFLTIEKAKNFARQFISPSMTENVTVNVREGDYYFEEPVEFSNEDSGQGGKFIIYKSYDGNGKAKLYGGRKVTGWVLDSGNIYKASVGKNLPLNTLYQGDKRAISARFPNREDLLDYPNSGAGYLLSKGPNAAGAKYIIYDEKDFDPANLKVTSEAKAVVWYDGVHDWNMWTMQITDIDPALKQINSSTEFTSEKIGVGARYFLQGFKEFLDMPGEYFYDRENGYLYYWPLEGKDPNSSDIYIPLTTTIFSLNGEFTKNSTTNPYTAPVPPVTKEVSNIAFDGFKLGYTNFVNDCTVWYSSDQLRTGTIAGEAVSKIAVTNCHFINSGIMAVFFGNAAKDTSVTNCLIENSGMSGIMYYAYGTAQSELVTGNYVNNCLIQNMGQLAVDSAGVHLRNAHNNEVSNCEIRNLARYAVSIRGVTGGTVGAQNNLVQYIKVVNATGDSGDVGALHQAQTNGVNGDKTNFFDQIYIDNVEPHPSVKDVYPNGIYLDNNSYNQKVSNVDTAGINKTYMFTDVLRMNKSGGAEYFNVCWRMGFDKSKMEYDKIGLLSTFPKEYELRNFNNYSGMQLFIDKNKAFVNKVQKAIDKDNPLVVPLVEKGRTLLPLRFIAENLGGAVSWDEKTETITITYKNKVSTLVIGKNTMTVDGTEHELLQAPKTVEGRTLLPLRDVAEKLFNKNVLWDERGLVIINNGETVSSEAADELVKMFE